MSADFNLPDEPVAVPPARESSAPIQVLPNPKPRPGPPAPHPSPSRSVFPIIMGVLFLGVMVASWVVGQNAPPTPPPSAPAAGAVVAPPAPETPSAAPGETALATRVEDLARQVEELQAKLDAMPKPEPAPDLGPIKSRLDDLAKLPEAVTPLPGKIAAVSERVDGLDKALEEIRSEVASLKEQGAKPAATAPAASPDASLADGAELFKQGKYADALTAFRKAQQAQPDDARTWYYSALATGLSTRQWQGETLQLAERGVERERAGTPTPAEIDAAFAGLTKANGKDWLDAIRKRVKR